MCVSFETDCNCCYSQCADTVHIGCDDSQSSTRKSVLVAEMSLYPKLIVCECSHSGQKLSRYIQSVVISKVLLYPKCCYIQSVVIPKVSLYPKCRYIQSVVISKVLLYPKCCYIQSVAISKVLLYPKCCYIQSVVISKVSPHHAHIKRGR